MPPAAPTAAAAVRAWYRQEGWTVFRFQQQAWRAYADGHSGLIHSPTGSGKTLAAWLGPVRAALAKPPGPGAALKVLWITPLRALAGDTRLSLESALKGVGLDWTVGLRTGDTPAGERTRQRRKPPDALVTTPESLSLLQSYADADAYFGALDAVIVDEWHELLGSKRGLLLQLSLSRLRALRPELRVWGLSATLGNLDEARDALLPAGVGGKLIEGPARKPAKIRTVIPESIDTFPWAGHLGLRLLPEVVKELDQPGSVLLFTNTRSQCELWFEELSRTRSDWIGQIAIHHGSVDRDHRRRVEQLLRDGELRCVVCTSSLDLGVDFPTVRKVIQIGSPKGVARLLQRAGRSDHRPGGRPEILCVPSHAFELLEIGAARRAAERGQIEARPSPQLGLDVLVQHLVTLALGGGFAPEATLKEVRSAYAYRELSDEEWQWALDFITRGGQALKAYPQFNRVELQDGVYRVLNRRIAAHHRMSVGTITSDSMMRLAWRSGGTLGYVEESFISKLRNNDRFLFAGRLVRLVDIKDMTAFVKKAKPGKRIVPRWQGSRMPLSTELADTVLELCGDPGLEPEGKALATIFELQSRWSAIPTPDSLLVESIKTRAGHSLFCYPFSGRTVHEGMATLLAYRLSQQRPATFRLAVNDYGFELLSDQVLKLTPEELRSGLSLHGLLPDLAACVNTGELARREFREIARIAGLVFQGYPSKQKATRHLQASSGLIFDVLQDYDPDNRLLRQAHEEVLQRSLDFRRLESAFRRLESRTLVMTAPPELTPFAFPIWATRVQTQTISSESWVERVQRMAERLQTRAVSGR